MWFIGGSDLRDLEVNNILEILRGNRNSLWDGYDTKSLCGKNFYSADPEYAWFWSKNKAQSHTRASERKRYYETGVKIIQAPLKE